MTTQRALIPLVRPDRPSEPQSWLRADILASLAELNEQYLDLIAGQAMTNPPLYEQGQPLLRELRPQLLSLDPGARRRAASCPYLLADAGFADPQRWLWARGYCVRDSGFSPLDQYLSTPQATALARQVITYAWHIARTHASAGRMLLGMTARTCEVLSAYTLRQVGELAEFHPQWLQPRWPGHARMWQELLKGAIAGEGFLLEQARMRGVQLLAAEARSSAQL